MLAAIRLLVSSARRLLSVLVAQLQRLLLLQRLLQLRLQLRFLLSN
jgi:hypothetical protein